MGWRSSLYIQNIEIFPCGHVATTACTFRHDSNSRGIIIDRQPIQELIWSVYDPSSMRRRRENQELNTAAFFRTLQSHFSKFSHTDNAPSLPFALFACMDLPTIFACLKAHPCLAFFPAHRNWIEALHTWAWASLSMASIEMLEGLQFFCLFFTKPHLEVPLPTFLDFRTKIWVKLKVCAVALLWYPAWINGKQPMQSIAMYRVAGETFSSRVGILPKLSLPAKHCHLSDSSTSLTCSAWHGNLESDELDFRRRDGSLPTAPAMTRHLGKPHADDLQVPCNAMPSQCINACKYLEPNGDLPWHFLLGRIV